VRAKLRDPSPDTRKLAIDILFQAAPRDSTVLDDFLSVIHDEQPDVQCHAVRTIQNLGSLGRRALPAIIDLLRSPVPEVRLAAADMIGSHGRAAGEAVPSLLALLEQPNPDQQATVGRVLGLLGEAAQPALPAMVALLSSEHPKVRSAMAQAIGGLELEPAVARPHLALALHDSDSDVRRAGLAGIQRYGRRGAIFVPDIMQVAKFEEDRMQVAESLKRFERGGPDPKSIPELVELLKHNDQAVRLHAVQFLGLAGPNAKDFIPVLETFLEDSDDDMRIAVKRAIEAIKSNRPTGRRQQPQPQ
jgi:HEAT repeat protein